MNNTGLNSAGPCTCGHFKIVNSVEFTTDYNQPLYDAWLVEPLRMALQIPRNCIDGGLTISYMWIFNCTEGWCSTSCCSGVNWIFILLCNTKTFVYDWIFMVFRRGKTMIKSFIVNLKGKQLTWIKMFNNRCTHYCQPLV